MKKRFLFLAGGCLVWTLVYSQSLVAEESYRLSFSTYIGGTSWEHARDVFADAQGNVYVCGGYGGYQNAFVAKLSSADTITLYPSRAHQTITGWEAVAFALEPTNPAFPNFKDALFDQAVNDLGINRVRLEIRSSVENSTDAWSDYQTGKIDYQTWRSRRYATVNDNADPRTIDPAGFHFSEMDNTIERIVNPLREVLAAKGAKLIVNVNYVAFTRQITDGLYIHNDPTEYAEFVLATYLHLKEKYGWVPNLWEVLLEPDNVSQWNGKLLGQAIAAWIHPRTDKHWHLLDQGDGDKRLYSEGVNRTLDRTTRTTLSLSVFEAPSVR